MKIIYPNEAGIQQAIAILEGGGVVAHATETCYGLACDVTNQVALQKVFSIKKRPENMPVSVLFASVTQAKKYVQWSNKAQGLANKYLPGALTLILPVLPGCPLYITPDAALPKSIGMRVSSHPVAQQLVQNFGSPICTTSANVHGESNPYSVADIKNQYSAKSAMPDLLIDSGTISHNDASTIVSISNDQVNVIRQGFIKI